MSAEPASDTMPPANEDAAPVRRPPIAAVIVAAGTGQRTGLAEPKQFVTLAGKPVLAHGVRAFAAHPAVRDLIIVVGSGMIDRCRQMLDEFLPDGAARPDLRVQVVAGGATRRLSVDAGLRAISPSHADDLLVMIHDAARPGVDQFVIDRLAAAFDDRDIAGAVPAIAVADSLARNDGDGLLAASVDRDGILRIQTPQAFRLPSIRAAHDAWCSAEEPTDDARMVQAIGHRIAIVDGTPMLDKITQIDDFARMEALLTSGWRVRTGMGFDVHAFAAGDHVTLCGVVIPHDRALAGHSDADVGLHAITDALLGAIGDGDIGDHFPPYDPQWQGAPSDRFARFAADRIRQVGGIIDHVDVTLICEAPKISPCREAMRQRLADILQLDLRQLSVKATTTEGLGFTGRREGIAAQAVATVRTRS